MYFRVASQMTEVIWTPQYIDMHLHVAIYDILNEDCSGESEICVFVYKYIFFV